MMFIFSSLSKEKDLSSHQKLISQRIPQFQLKQVSGGKRSCTIPRSHSKERHFQWDYCQLELPNINH